MKLHIYIVTNIIISSNPKLKILSVYIRIDLKIIIYVYKKKLYMAVCNIFRPLTNSTGNFFTFSQYMEDLTKEFIQSSNWHIIPTRYVALEGNYENFTNSSIARKMQEQFENALAYAKNNIDNYTPELSKKLFWDFLFSNNIISKNEDNTINGIHYVGDINLQSYNEYDGMGYSEIYCYIPNDAPKTIYITDVSVQNTTVYNINTGEILEGYQNHELQGWEVISQDYAYEYGKSYEFSWEENSGQNKLTSVITRDESFKINTLVVLYSIYNDDEVIFKDIPLGIYFSGLISDGIMMNHIDKYVSHGDIYNAGTSYGLRICSRFVVSPLQDNLLVQDVSIDNNNYSDLTRVLAEMSVTQQKMNEIIVEKHSQTQMLKDMLATFMNSQTNVPYIKTINGNNYWFVNGKMINSSTDSGCGCIPYTETEMDELMGINQILTIELNVPNNITVFEKTDSNPTTNIQWTTKYKGDIIIPESLYINGIKQNNLTDNVFEHTIENDEDTIDVYALYKHKSARSTITFHKVSPSYFGYIECEDSDSFDHEFIPSEDQIKTLPKHLLTSKTNEFNIDNELTTLKHVVYAYPESYGRLYDITDEEGFVYYTSYQNEEYNDFNVSTVTIDNIPYLVYVDRSPVIVQNQKLKFN